MKFYSDIEGNQTVVVDGKRFKFINGELETKDQNVINVLSKLYRSDNDGRQTEQGDEKGQEVEAEQTEEDEGIDFEEMTYNELKELAKVEGVTIGRKSKAELIEALKEGE